MNKFKRTTGLSIDYGCAINSCDSLYILFET
jgi:hypothetical protein